MKKNINEAPVKVNPSLYSNIKFEDYVVGSSMPSKDKINPSLLADINKAAKSLNIIASITTAVSGHDKGTRHEVGNAVDISRINGISILSLDNAKKKGIYDTINKFVDELVKLGYLKNTESGNDKSVLTFGVKGHDNHVHVSRNSDGGTSPNLTDPASIATSIATSNTTGTDIADYNYDPGIVGGMLGMLGINENDRPNQSIDTISEEIKRIKTLMK